MGRFAWLIAAVGVGMAGSLCLGGDDPPHDSSSDEVAPTERHEQVLREGFELLDDGELAAAVRAFQRVAVRADAETLQKLSRLTRELRGEPLDELLAETRMRVALSLSRGRTFDLRYATPYEGAALGRRLEMLADDCLHSKFDGRTLLAWARDPAKYEKLRIDTAELEFKARLAAGVIAARLKHDPRLKKVRPAVRNGGDEGGALSRDELVRLRDDLARLGAQIRALPGFTALTMRRDTLDDPTLIEAERLEEARRAAELEAAEREAAAAERELEEATSRPADATSQPATRPTSNPASQSTSRPAAQNEP